MNEIVEVERAPWEETLTELANGRAARIAIPRSKDLRRQQVVNAFQDAFHLIGGTPRLALWADENPSEFYRLYSKLLPKEQKETDKEIVINHVLPKGALD